MTEILNFIDGRNVAGEGASIDDLDPSTGEVIATLSEASERQVGAAVETAKHRFEAGEWSRAPIAERQPVLRRAAAAIRAASDEIVELQVAEAGITPAAVRGQLGIGAAWFDYFADLLTTVAGRFTARRQERPRLSNRNRLASVRCSRPGTCRLRFRP